MTAAGTKAVFEPDTANPGSAMNLAFAAMLRTDNLRPFGQMIAENHVDLVNKVPQKISVYGNGLGNNGELKGPDIAMEIGASP